MKNKRSKYERGIVILCLVFSAGMLIYPSIYEKECKNRVYSQIQQNIKEEQLCSNIMIIGIENKQNAEGDVCVSYSNPACGVIVKKDNSIYYALTAYHVVSDRTKYYVALNYFTPSYKDNDIDEHIDLERYYSNLNKIEVIATDKKSDLALVKFESSKKLNAFSISKKDPEYNDQIVTIALEGENKCAQSYGKIRSKDYIVFEAEPGNPINTYVHNAYIHVGSSGSAVLDKNLKIVGINTGGDSDIFHRYKRGYMIPCKIINEFLDENLIINN